MSHYITCHNCGEPECMDSDTGVHRRDDGTVCPDPRDAQVEGLRAEVERLKERADGCPDSENEDACGECVHCARVGMRSALDGRAEALATVAGLQAEVARLRAAAIPEDAEEIVFKELSIGVFEPQDLEIQEAIHAKRRAKASAVVKALRGQT